MFPFDDVIMCAIITILLQLECLSDSIVKSYGNYMWDRMRKVGSLTITYRSNFKGTQKIVEMIKWKCFK